MEVFVLYIDTTLRTTYWVTSTTSVSYLGECVTGTTVWSRDGYLNRSTAKKG